MSFVFPPFRLELNSEQLWREDQIIALRPKTFAVLRYLVEHPRQLVTKDALLDVVWAGTVVSDTVLKSCIRELRLALADDVQDPQFIATVHRRGYRWVAADAAPVPRSRFQVPGLPATTTQPHRGPLNVERGTLLVGRESELMQLQGCLDKALRSERQLVFVTGEAGIGKTTLVEAFLAGIGHQGTGNGEQENQKAKGKNQKAKVEEPAPSPQHLAPGVWVAWGQCIEQYGAGEAYMPILEALGRLCRAPGGDQLIALLNHHAPTWLVQMPTLLNATELETLQRKVQGATRERMLREMGEAINAITAEQPLVLWLEDLHWSDPSTLELLSLLARRREPARLLILGTYRPVDVIVSEHPLRAVKQELQLHGHCHELAVRLLREEAIEKYLAARVQVPPPAQAGEGRGESLSARALANLAHTIHQRTEGNPLFMVNIVDELLTQERGDSAAIEVSIPETIRQMIERHCDQLHATEQRVLEAASVAGVEFSAAAVAAGADVAVDESEEHCASLARRGQFLQAKGTAEWPDGTITTQYGFLHALYREVTYERIPIGRRRNLHQRIGERTEIGYGQRAKEIAAALAVHFERSRDYQRAVQYLQQAGEQASKRLALREAIAHLNQGIKIVGLLPQSPERDGYELDLRIPLGMAWLGLKGWAAPEVWTSLHPALGLAKSLRRHTALLPIYYGLWNNVSVQGHVAESLDWGHDMLAAAEAGGDADLLIVAHRALCDTYFYRGDFIESRVHGERVLELYNEERHRSVADLIHNDPKSTVDTYVSLGTWMLGYPDRAVQESEAIVTHARRRGHPFDLSWVLTTSSLLWTCRCAPEQILARIEEAERLGRAHDLPFISDVIAPIWKGVAWLQAGCLVKGIPQLQGGMETWNAHGAEVFMPYLRATLGEGLALSGDITGGLRVIEESLTQIARPEWEERWCLAEVLRLKGWILALQGDLAGAEQQYLASLDWAREQHAKSWELRTATSLARLWQQQGKKKEAHKLLSEIYGWFTEGFDTKDLQEAQALLNTLK